LKIDVEDYFKREVYPHVSDALYVYEYDPNKKASNTNKEKLGAEIPFTRYFYEYQRPEKADDLISQFADIERGIVENVAALLGGVEK
jgi:type I restriction enzyme M protein